MSLEAEKRRDELHTQIEEIEEQLQPKRTRSDADAGDAPDVSVCKDIMSCFSFLFLGVPRHYVKRPFSCWCKTCSRVRGRGLGSQSSDPDLLVAGCTRAKQTTWTEDLFTVTSSVGIRNHEKRVSDIVVRELKRAKPDTWCCVQSREEWSTEEETHRSPGHFWICKLGTFPGRSLQH